MKKKRVLSVVGARPQFVKAAVVCRALAELEIPEVLVHTGQHYDDNMSGIFFSQMGIPKPAYNLEVGSGGHAFQTGQTMERLETVCLKESPDMVIVYGDTNATLAGGLVAAKLNIPLAHVEAGLRSFDRRMPEEVNRVVVDHLSQLLFCPTRTAVENLASEGVVDGVHNVGDVMYDATLRFQKLASGESAILRDLDIEEHAYALVTIHRDFNTDDSDRLSGIVEGLLKSGCPMVFPVHPRVRKQLKCFDLLERLEDAAHVKLIPPVGYLDMIRLESAAAGILTDSGGVQKEAFFLNVPCLTVRPSSEWVETIDAGWNQLVEPNPIALADGLRSLQKPDSDKPEPFGDGRAGQRIAERINKYL